MSNDLVKDKLNELLKELKLKTKHEDIKDIQFFVRNFQLLISEFHYFKNNLIYFINYFIFF